MNLIKYFAMMLLLIGAVSCGKLKLFAIKRPHFGFVGLKVRTPKFFGHKHGHGGFGGGGFHSSGYEHHEYHHESHHSSSFGGGGFGGGGFGHGFGGWGK